MRYSSAQQIVRKIARLKKKGFDENSKIIIDLNSELEQLRNAYLYSIKEIQNYPVKYLSWNKNDKKVADITEIFSLIKSKETYYGYYTTHRYKPSYKRNSYTPCGLFYGINSIRKLNGLLLFQIKGKTLRQSDFQAIKSDNFTFATYYEFEEKTTNIFVKTQDISPSNIVQLQEMIKNHYSKKLKQLKITIPEFTISLPLTHDAALYHNENSIAFKLQK